MDYNLSTYDESDEEPYIDIDHSEYDKKEVSRIRSFWEVGCGCTLSPYEKGCVQAFDIDQVYEDILACQSYPKEVLDAIIIGQLRSMTPRLTPEKRLKSRMAYKIDNLIVCRDTFCFLNSVSVDRLKALKKHYHDNGLNLRSHGNLKKLPSNITSMVDIYAVKDFLKNYAEIYGLVIPGRQPGFKLETGTILPTKHSKSFVYQKYKEACQCKVSNYVSYGKFRNLWLSFHPDIITAKPRTDLCELCQKNISSVIKSQNKNIEEKKEAVLQLEDHLRDADIQRTDYNKRRETATIEHIKDNPQSATYSFDFAQMVHYPHNTDQPGSIFFKVPRKCLIFGVNNEGNNQQVTYLIDEIVDCGKGANVVISYIYHYLENHCRHTPNISLQADNCSGQNKNNYFLFYMVWRILTKKNLSISYNFLMAGHTKFSPDRLFGVFKKRFGSSFCSSLYEVADAVRESSANNTPQLCGLPTGEVIVPVYDWVSFFSTSFDKLPKLLPFHVFSTNSSNTGVISCQRLINSEITDFTVLKRKLQCTFPTQIIPKGLSQQRKIYLYKEMRPYCRLGTEDYVGPNPFL